VPFQWLGWGGGELGSGALPGVSYGVAAGVLGERGPFAARLGVLAIPRAITGLEGAGEAHFRSALGQLEACGHALQGGRLWVALCLGGRAGMLQVHTTGLAVTASSRQFFAALELAVRLELRPHTAWRVFAQLGALLPLRNLRYTYDIDDMRTQYHVTLPGIALSCGAIFGPRS